MNKNLPNTPNLPFNNNQQKLPLYSLQLEQLNRIVGGWGQPGHIPPHPLA